MKVNDYVRTKNGYISKYIGKNKTPYTIGKHLSFETTIRDVRFKESDNDTMIWESELEKGLEKIIKSSPNIIDLLMVGDYVNGMQVTRICFDEDGQRILNLSNCILELMNEDIKSIVTKEQFERCEYKI